eukprot:TRINITY_DN3883_c5_g1_i1.p1 TRINITY_DN3883_c5_g1~~TRINITY_DN3883_c5_g1_i1.p1  ORF type:complete len:545 (+),score=169.94 TRINITY_DN3883_c5_g1_i1:45-1637(+)
MGRATPTSPARFTCGRMEARAVAPQPALGVLRTAGLIFVAAIGGAYGLEGCVGAGGGLWTLLGVAVLPWLWGLPTALVVAELATSIPANSGVDAWVACAYPTWYTIMSMMWTFWCNRLDNATYPNLFMDYISQSHDFAPWETVALRIGFVALCTLPNVLGVEIVGAASVLLMVLSILPFVLLFVVEWGVHGLHVEHVWAVPDAGVNWGVFVPTLLWNISGFDSAGHVAEEVQGKPHTLIGALVIVLFLTQVVYGLPVVAGISAETRAFAANRTGHASATDFTDWDDGYFVTLARWVEGEWLGTVMTVGAVTSSLGFMVSLLCTTSRALQGHAMLGLFPQPVCDFLRPLHPTFKTPVNAVLVNAALCAGTCLAADFETLLSISTILYSCRLLTVLCACPLLRWKHPTLPRPFAIPLGCGALCAVLALPVLICAGCVVFALQQDAGVAIATSSIIAASFGVGLVLSWLYFPTGLDSRITYDYDSIDTATPRPTAASPGTWDYSQVDDEARNEGPSPAAPSYGSSPAASPTAP